MMGQVLHGGDTLTSFAITNGVKQGCVLAPVLFNLFFACMLSQAVKDSKDWVYIRHRLAGSLFDLTRLNAKIKCLQELIQEALYADVFTLLAHNERDLQMMVDKFSQASKLFGLTINISKTEALYQPAPNTNPQEPTITIDGIRLKNIDSFKYLGI